MWNKFKERWKQRSLQLNVKKAVLTFIITAVVVICGFSIAGYAKFGSRIRQQEAEHEQQEQLPGLEATGQQGQQEEQQTPAQDSNTSDTSDPGSFGDGMRGAPAAGPGIEYEKEGRHTESETDEAEDGDAEEETEDGDGEEEAEESLQEEYEREGSREEWSYAGGGAHRKGRMDHADGFDGMYDHGHDMDGEQDAKNEIQFTTSDKALIVAAGIAGVVLLIWYWILCMMWAYRKATRLGVSGPAWVVATLFFNLLAILVLYLYGFFKGTCRKCGHVRRHGENYCERCGEPFETECPNCGHLVRAGAKYCPNCGKKMEEDTPASAADHVPADTQKADTTAAEPDAAADRTTAAGKAGAAASAKSGVGAPEKTPGENQADKTDDPAAGSVDKDPDSADKKQ